MNFSLPPKVPIQVSYTPVLENHGEKKKKWPSVVPYLYTHTTSRLTHVKKNRSFSSEMSKLAYLESFWRRISITCANHLNARYYFHLFSFTMNSNADSQSASQYTKQKEWNRRERVLRCSHRLFFSDRKYACTLQWVQTANSSSHLKLMITSPGDCLASWLCILTARAIFPPEIPYFSRAHFRILFLSMVFQRPQISSFFLQE